MLHSPCPDRGIFRNWIEFNYFPVGEPIMLDAYTRTMCQKSWGRNTYARVLIKVSALTPLMESVVVVIPYPDGSGHSLETVDVEYEWQPPLPRLEKDDDGFMKVTRKNGKGKQDGKTKNVVGIKLTKPKPNLVYKVVHKPQNNNDKEASSSKHDELIDSYDQLICNSFE
ncbi:hypothetical protein Tco_0207193 [Tanacetum coccineum]